jgi:hypothetical protein
MANRRIWFSAAQLAFGHRLLAHAKLVAREGAAPSTSGCRPDVMLFHHRAFGIYE